MASISRGFPQEIIDAIVEELDNRCLKACSLAGPAFTTPTRRRLFRFVALAEYRPQAIMQQRFCDLLAFSPRVALFVRELVVLLDRKSQHEQTVIILKELGELQTLRLDGHFSNSPLEKAILNFLANFRLKHLHISSGKVTPVFLASAMVACPKLTLGSMGLISHADSSAAFLPTTSPAVALTSLHLQHRAGNTMASLYAFLIRPATSRYLRSLTRLHLHEACPKEFYTACLSLTSPTLETFILDCLANGDALPALPPLPALRYLEFRVPRSGAARVENTVRDMRAGSPQVEVLVRVYG
ncbi:hypothetical protein C8J57DRAFT_1507205 [Mycena rebaudengoi]|nr:hypothetical protein C8J57DRAFT_1507205 [Mycena rebaudengoi]